MGKKALKKNDSITPKEYTKFLEHIKTDIQQTQLKAATSISKELTSLYWRIGKELSERIKTEGWGTKAVEKLAHELTNMFPGIAGFSRANIFRMRAFFEAYNNCRTAVRQLENLPIFSIPWGHNIALLEKLQDCEQQLWYAQKTLENGWSRAILTMWMESNLYNRQGNIERQLLLPVDDNYCCRFFNTNLMT
jgi:predicted nuclease of restriction endonuclease-like (RecB) superfamily